MGITVPKILMSQIDDKRGDISRSRYVTRMLEKSLLNVESQKVIEGIGFQPLPSTTAHTEPQEDHEANTTSERLDVYSLHSGDHNSG
jgi:hypothetical protein